MWVVRWFDFPLGAMSKAGHEHLDRFPSARLGLEALGLLEHPSRSVEEISIRLTFEDLHHEVPPRPKPVTCPIKQFVAEPHRSMMVTKGITRGIGRHVRQKHVEVFDPDGSRFEFPKITFDQFYLFGHEMRVDLLEIDRHDPAPGADSFDRHLTPGPRCRSRVEHQISSGHHSPTLIDFNELEGCSRAIALSLRLSEPVVLHVTHRSTLPARGSFNTEGRGPASAVVHSVMIGPTPVGFSTTATRMSPYVVRRMTGLSPAPICPTKTAGPFSFEVVVTRASVNR